jgi:hypothetical protein
MTAELLLRSPDAMPWAKMPLFNACARAIQKPAAIVFFQESSRLVAESER